MIHRLAMLFALAAFTAEAQVNRLDPAYEGLYDITIKCPSGKCGEVKPIGRMSLMDVGRAGVEVMFHHTKINTPIYFLRANRVDNDGAHLEADAFSTMGRAIEWIGEIDRATGSLSGRLRLAGADDEIQVDGKRVYTPASFYQPQDVSNMLSVLEIQGSYTANRATPTSFSVRSTLSGNPPVVATWFLNHGVRIDFNDSEFLPEQGVLLLYSRGNLGTLKWTVALKRNTYGLVEGNVSAFSSINGGASYGFSLTRPAQRIRKR